MNDLEWSDHYKKVTSTPTYRAIKTLFNELMRVDDAENEMREATRRAAEVKRLASDKIKNALAQISVVPPEIEDGGYVISIDEEWYEHKDIFDAVKIKKLGVNLFQYAEEQAESDKVQSDVVSILAKAG